MKDDRITIRLPKKLKKEFIAKCKITDKDLKPSYFIRKLMEGFAK